VRISRTTFLVSKMIIDPFLISNVLFLIELTVMIS
jgi:hypothetical protein